MQDAETPQFRVGEVDVDASRGVVVRAGVPVYLRQQAFEVLLYLLRNDDRVVSKQELFDHIWKDTAVTDDAVVQCIVEIRKAIGDEARTPRFIRTIPKSGYRLIAPVQRIGRARIEEAAKERADEGATAAPARPAIPERARVAWPIAAAAAGLILACGLAIYLMQGPGSGDALTPGLVASPGLRRVMVVPFDDRTSTPEFAWLRQGLPDMFVTSLRPVEGVAVLDREQAEMLIARLGIDPDESVPVARALEAARRGNAELMVTGSYERVGSSLRVESRVHDVSTGAVIGADTTVSVHPEDLLPHIDGLVSRTARRLSGATPRERGSVVDVMTNNLEAYRCYVLGFDKAKALEAAAAIDWFQKAVQADPQFAMAYARIGYTYAITLNQPERARPYLEKAFQLSARLTDKDRANIAAWYSIAHLDYPAAIEAYRRVIDRYPEDVEAYWRLGMTLAGENKPAEAIEVLLRGRAIDPEHPEIHNALGGVYINLKRYREAIAMFTRYAELDATPNAHDSVGLGHVAAGDYPAALAAFDRALALKPDFEIAIVHRGNTLFALGRYRDALASYDRYIEASAISGDANRGRAYKAWVEFRRGNSAEAWREMQLVSKSGAASIEAMVIGFQHHPAIARQWYAAMEQTWPNRGIRGPLRQREYVAGRYAELQGDAEGAFSHLAKALQYPPTFWHVEDYEECLADGYLRAGRFADAIKEYERVLGDNPNKGLPRFHLAEALERSGQKDRALVEYRTFLEVWRKADRDLPEVRLAEARVAAR